MTVDAPEVAAFRAVSARDADGDELRRILDALPTDRLRRVEQCAVRVIWAARDIRDDRSRRTP